MRLFLFMALCLSALLPDPVCGQGFNPPGFNPYQQQVQNDARGRRARREQAFFRAGGTPEARAAVEKYGEDFVAAVSVCSPDVAAKLADFAVSPVGLARLPRPGEFLRMLGLAQHGDDVAVWAIQHVEELSDVDQFGAFMLAPLDYALGLQSLSAGAAQYRANRLATPPPPAAPLTLSDLRLPSDWRPIAVCGAAVVLAAWYLWRRRLRQGA